MANSISIRESLLSFDGSFERIGGPFHSFAGYGRLSGYELKSHLSAAAVHNDTRCLGLHDFDPLRR